MEPERLGLEERRNRKSAGAIDDEMTPVAMAVGMGVRIFSSRGYLSEVASVI
jgi:hypothetical protein